MITLHIAKLLEVNGLGTLSITGNEPNADIFWEGITLSNDNDSKNGVWIESRGFPISRGITETQAFDIYARYASPLQGSKKLKAIFNFLKEAYGDVCDLPIVAGHSEAKYVNVSIQPTNNIENVGVDGEGRRVWAISGQISYKEQLN